MSENASENRSRLDPEPVPRRDFLGLSAFWSSAAALAFAAIGMLRLPKAAVLASRSKKFSTAIPESLAPGEPFVAPGRAVALFRDDEGVHAISLVCTHLGCIVKAATEGFECPCHGSRFSTDGAVVKGPAPTALPWLKVSVVGNKVVVDEESNVPAGTKVSV